MPPVTPADALRSRCGLTPRNAGRRDSVRAGPGEWMKTLKSQTYSESSVALLERGRAGDAQALDILFARYLPLLNRWAAGRLPAWARDLSDTRDLLQDALMGSLKHLDGIDIRGPGALASYMEAATT